MLPTKVVATQGTEDQTTSTTVVPASHSIEFIATICARWCTGVRPPQISGDRVDGDQVGCIHKSLCVDGFLAFSLYDRRSSYFSFCLRVDHIGLMSSTLMIHHLRLPTNLTHRLLFHPLNRTRFLLKNAVFFVPPLSVFFSFPPPSVPLYMVHIYGKALHP